ncbi:DUF2490 domain-containing protein [Hymenobacter busanensis]|uniref:DUF2490 domain-containing protein n=1 Tax=Hymenobacter busanensis TaxID=2607656 RepID=A0A7L5A0B1_9BACT|nr:DUF2490 domain-containing protein [Hymenobacter busanensis]KAA9338613.1 DUF2490 domain-containing protein [Hymenobacter busanensis]QHJ08958.1 DUF2490 domain-containing protein [Hymenobacter busanensis]
MKFWTIFPVLACVAVLGHEATAQRRATNPTALWPEVQLELARQSGDYFWLALHGQRSTDNDINQAGPFYQYHALGGYEHFLSDHWSIGANVRYQHEPGTNLLLPEGLLRHRGDLGGITFGQRLSLEYAFRKAPARKEGLARLRFDAYRSFTVGRLALRPRLAFDAGTVLRIQPPDEQPNERTIDQTRLRAEVGIRLSDHVDLTPYFLRQSDYFITQPQFDLNGNITISGGRRNLITPVVGLDLRFTLFEGQNAFERVQLPTQH